MTMLYSNPCYKEVCYKRHALYFSGHQLKEQLEGQLNNNRNRMTGLQQDFENINEERVKLLDDIDEMKKRTESCHEGTILHRNYRKLTMQWSFSYNSFVKFHGKKIWEPQHDHVIFKSLLYRVFYKSSALYFSGHQLKEQLEGQLNNNRDRMTGLQQDFENINEERVKLLDEIDEIKKRTESGHKGTILQRNYRKRTMQWSFSYNFFVKFHGKKIWEPQHDHVIFKFLL